MRISEHAACQTAAKPTMPASAKIGADTPLRANCGRATPASVKSDENANEPSAGIAHHRAIPAAAKTADEASASAFAARAEINGQKHATASAHTSGAYTPRFKTAL